LGLLLGDYVDVLSIAETKLDDSFPPSQFCLQNFKRPYRLDISGRSGGLLTFVRSDIPSRQLTNTSIPSGIQILCVELNLRKRKWILLNVYRPPKQDPNFFLDKLSECLIYFSNYDSIIINGDMNLEPVNPILSNFVEVNSLHNHIKEKTCWKSVSGTCIDLILSNSKYSLFNSGTVETGLSDHHLLVYSMLKMTFNKLPPQAIKYRSWKNFDSELFKYDLLINLDCNVDKYTTFESIFNANLNKHAPLKTKFLRGNNQLHLTKTLI